MFGGSRAKEAAYDPNRYLRKFRYPKLHVMFVLGSEDTGRRHVIDQAVLARRSGMHVSFRLVKGGHTFRVWRTAFDEFLPEAWRSLAPPSELGSATAVRATAAEQQTVATHCDRDDDLRSRPCPPLRSGSAAPN